MWEGNGEARGKDGDEDVFPRITERRDEILASPVFSKSMLVPTLYPTYKVITNHSSDCQSSI